MMFDNGFMIDLTRLQNWPRSTEIFQTENACTSHEKGLKENLEAF